MEQEPRRQFMRNLHEFIEPIQLNQAFMDGLKEHSNSEYITELVVCSKNPQNEIFIRTSIQILIKKKFADQMTRKMYIFTEFTRERSTCDEMIRILRNSGQEEAAEKLKKFNTSPPFIEESNEIELKVTPAVVLRSGGTKLFPMDQKPRGKCIIINNVKEKLIKESLRFESIFKQLFFDVELCYNMSANQMECRLKELSKEKRLANDNALIVMIISHGHDEKIIGYDENDLRISTIVDIFSETNCPALHRKPKLFFFNCCRNKEREVPCVATQYPQQNKIIIELETVGQNWINNNKYSFICFTCAEGYESWYIPNQFTHFGQALSHIIAQYSCDKSLLSIINLTYDKMSNIGSPEIRMCKMTRDLYFNPALPKSNK